MPKSDEQHFDDYSDQNRVKHAILARYLPAYLTALKNRAQGFHYIDGFAGRGIYAGEHPGSPLLALEAIAQKGLAARSAVSLVEDIQRFFTELEVRVTSHPASPNLAFDPLICHGHFSTYIDSILDHPIYRRFRPVATFSFVDPCGIEGIRMTDLARLLQLSYGELLLFFNYSGFARILGGVRTGTATGEVLIAMLGSPERLHNLLRDWDESDRPFDREILIRDHMIAALRADSGAKYFCPFRFEASGAERTSHYVVHCCQDSLGFKIMKSVMWTLGRDDVDPYGKMELIREEERGKQFQLLRSDIVQQRQRVLDRLHQSPCRVSEFADVWVRRPEDGFSAEAYKQLLIELEQDSRLLVFDKHDSKPRPATDRRKTKAGQPSLGDDLWLHLAN